MPFYPIFKLKWQSNISKKVSKSINEIKSLKEKERYEM